MPETTATQTRRVRRVRCTGCTELTHRDQLDWAGQCSTCQSIVTAPDGTMSRPDTTWSTETMAEHGIFARPNGTCDRCGLASSESNPTSRVDSESGVHGEYCACCQAILLAADEEDGDEEEAEAIEQANDAARWSLAATTQSRVACSRCGRSYPFNGPLDPMGTEPALCTTCALVLQAIERSTESALARTARLACDACDVISSRDNEVNWHDDLDGAFHADCAEETREAHVENGDYEQEDEQEDEDEQDEIAPAPQAQRSTPAQAPKLWIVRRYSAEGFEEGTSPAQSFDECQKWAKLLAKEDKLQTGVKPRWINVHRWELAHGATLRIERVIALDETVTVA